MAGLKVDVTAIPTPGTGTPAGFKVDVTSLPAGFQGIQGEKGDKGDKGDQGEPGASGSLAGLNGHNSFTYVWKDNATITIKANGQATSADGAYTYTLSADTDLSLPGGLDAGSEAANTKYYIWAGLAGGVLTFKFSLSDTTPAGLTNPIRLPGCIRNNVSSNILPFQWEGDFYRYMVEIKTDGTDQTQIYSGAVPTSGTPLSLDLSAFVPTGKTGQVIFGTALTGGISSTIYDLQIRVDGKNRKYVLPVENAVGFEGVVDIPYSFAIWCTSAALTAQKIAVLGFWN